MTANNKKRLLIIDRDGTIIKEPPVDFQVDSLEKLEFIPGAISSLHDIAGLDFEFVLATNQDGLGTSSFPEEAFYPAHEKMLSTLAGEGFCFDCELIDRSFPDDNSPCRKPGIGMFGRYLEGDYNLEDSYVVGDRLTDILLARNLGAKGIYFAESESGTRQLNEAGLSDVAALVTDDWREIARFLRASARVSEIYRRTSETEISVRIDLDGSGKADIETGLGFLNHMIAQIPHHSGVDLSLHCKGDLEVDEHHTIEDCAIALGDAILQALGDKRGIERYGFMLPMDECRALVLIDLGGRIDFQWSVPFTREYVGDVPTEMFRHFFYSLCCSLKCNLHIEASGENNHHLIEGVFKAFARALRMAVRRDTYSLTLPSSKGML